MSSKDSLENSFVEIMAKEASCRPQQVRSADALFAEGATVPFIARYRKEVTGGLEDVQLELLAKRRDYFLDLTQRRDAILESLNEQGLITPDLEASIKAATSKQELEDLYLPYKPRRRTRAQMARERGLEPLASGLLVAAAENGSAEDLAAPFVGAHEEVPDTATALAGARDILAEQLAEAAENRSELRRVFRSEGVLRVRGVTGKEKEGAVYRDYWDHHEPAKGVASHRLLAILRGERDGFLFSDLEIDDERQVSYLEDKWKLPMSTPCGLEVAQATADGYKRLLRPSISNETRKELRQRAEAEAIRVFRDNLEALLLQAPLGQVPVLGLDPGLRTGCKLAVVDVTGRVVETGVIRPIPPAADEPGAKAAILRSIETLGVRAVAVGNGTGSRETEAFVRRVVMENGHEKVIVAIVPETGASVYSASEVARKEFPDMDVSLRGAVSIARRLQDPLAELVKIEPRSLGVGQYQHDVDQKALNQELNLTVERAVNRVGVELNTASAELLQRVSGLTDRLARSVVGFRDSHGAFDSRKRLLDVPGLGPKTFELAAGFLRLRDGAHPLDRTGVHPERYRVVERMANHLGKPLGELVGSSQWVSKIDFSAFADAGEGLGRFTLEDIRQELEKPGRDPRPNFEVPQWRSDVTGVEDLQAGMVLEGRVSNVTNFGAFVDIGVKRDGLVHISELSQGWVGDPREAVQVGQVVKVKVKEIDRERLRIGLSMKDLTPGGEAPSQKKKTQGKPKGEKAAQPPGRSGSSAPRPPRSGHKKANPPREKAATGPASIGDLMRKFNRR